jgi:signal transduction histidine kinase
MAAVERIGRAATAMIRSSPVLLAGGLIAAFLAVAGVVAILVFGEIERHLTRQIVASLQQDASALARLARGAGSEAVAEAVRERARAGPPSLVILLDADGTRIAGNLSRWPAELRAAGGSGAFRYASEEAGGRERWGVGIAVEIGTGRLALIGRDLTGERALQNRIGWLFLAGVGLIALAAGAIALAWSRLTRRRIGAITQAADRIMAGDLGERIALSAAGDELDQLAERLNAMLARLEALVAGMREISDNIAHDLKTPLNRLRNRAEAALADPRGDSARREGLERTIEAADDIIKTFNALLLIARVEAGVVAESFEAFDLAALVRDVAELYEPVAEEAGTSLAISAPSPVTVVANRQLIGQAVANMIDNAIKYGTMAPSSGRPGEPIVVAVAAHAGGARVVVADRGPGIPPEARERVLRRFVRLEASRSRPGTGLGLSLVAAVASLHGGHLELADNGPGLKAELTLAERPVRPAASGASNASSVHAGGR